MLKSIVKALGLIAGLALSGVACAMGMGGINVTTALGEPLRAEIELVAVGKAEKNSLSAHLASPAIFKGAGMDYPSGLPALKFQIETRANGESYLKVTSIQPVNEPFVSLLVELSWSSGKLLREYTFLLDPPGYKAEQPKAAEVKPVTPSVEAAPGIETAPIRATAPMEEKVFAEAPTPAPDRKPPASSNVASGVIKVKRGDTLSEIALQSKPAGVSLERMLVALYRSNAGAFDGNNMNRLKTGEILHMPASHDLDKLAQVEAAKEIRVQVADWHAYKQKLAAASGIVAEQAPKQEATGKISTTVADKTPAAKEPAKEVVRLSKGEAPGDKAVAAGDTKALQNKVHALEEEAIAKGKALKESNERVAMLEKNIKEMQHLIELKGQPAAPAKPVLSKVEGPVLSKVEEPAKTKPIPKPEPAKVEAKPPTPAPAVAPAAAPQPPAASAVAATSAVAPASAVKPAKPAAKPVAAPKVEPPPPSLLDEPLYLAGGAAALLALGGLGYMLVRRGKGGKAEKKISGSSEAAGEDIGVSSGRFSEPVAPSPETGDFTQATTATPISPAQTEDVDPINEADLFMSFGRDAQAEEILKDALGKNPASNQIRLKLLSIYVNRKDTKSFSDIARQVQDSGDTAAWTQAAEMGRNLEPNNPMYGGKGGKPVIAAAVDQGKSEPQHATGLDFDLGVNTPVAAAANENESTMLFNAPPGEKTIMAMTSAGLHTMETPMDFDITSTHPSLAAMTEEKPAADISASAGDALAFTLDFPIADKPAAAKEVVDFDLSGINLDLGEPTAPAAGAEAKDAHWQDVATKLDLAKAYQEMGDNAGAREILEEVLAEGDEQQRAAAEDIMRHLLA